MSDCQVYVGSYAKYNNGNLFGKWIDLEGHTPESFHEECIELHKDEEDPELMFQDYQGFPSEWYGESHIDPKAFEFADLSDDDQEMFKVYVNDVNQSGTIDEAREAFRGKYSSKADYVQEFYDDTGGLEGVPDEIKNNIDWDGIARDWEHGDMTFVDHDGDVWVFVS